MILLWRMYYFFKRHSSHVKEQNFPHKNLIFLLKRFSFTYCINKHNFPWKRRDTGRRLGLPCCELCFAGDSGANAGSSDADCVILRRCLPKWPEYKHSTAQHINIFWTFAGSSSKLYINMCDFDDFNVLFGSTTQNHAGFCKRYPKESFLESRPKMLHVYWNLQL